MTTLPLGTAVVPLAENVCEVVVQLVIAPVTVVGVPHTSPPAFVQSMTTAWPSVGATDQLTDGLPSPDCQSRYQAMTLQEPAPTPAAIAPSANSVPIGVQPAGSATVMVYVFHDTNRNILSPAAGVPGMVTELGSATILAHVPAVLREIAIRTPPFEV